MRLLIASGLAVLLIGCVTASAMSDGEARQKLAKAGIVLWPPDREADPYSPPYSYLKQEKDGTFRLYLRDESLADLSVLAGVPISDLHLRAPRVRDLAPLAQLPLMKLSLTCHPETTISPLRGRAIRSLDIAYMGVRDLAPLKGMPLEELWFNPYIVTNGMDIVVSNPELDYIVTCSPHDDRQSWNRETFLAKQERWGFRPDSTGHPPDQSAILTSSLSVCATTFAGFTTARQWELTVLPDGRLFFLTHDYGDDGKHTPRERTVSLSTNQLQALRQCIASNAYHTLESIYGDNIIDASSRTLCIRVGNQQRTIKIQAFHNRLNGNDPQLLDAKRLLRVWQMIQSFVTLPQDCLDFAEDDQKVMEWKAPNKAPEDTARKLADPQR